MYLFTKVLNFSRNVAFNKSLKGWRTYVKLSYRHNIGKEPLKPLTIGQLFEITTRKYPDREAVVSVHQKQRVTYQEVLTQADKLAAGFRTLDLKKGDRIGIWAPNIVEWIITTIACARAGFVLVAMNPAYQAREIESCINKVGIKALVCPDTIAKYKFLEILSCVAPKLENCDPGKLCSSNIPTLKFVILISDESVKGTYNFNEVLNLASENSIKGIKENQQKIEPDAPFDILFTSGTTGQPKAAVLSHFQVVNNSFQTGKRKGLEKKHHKICVQVPLFHAFGLTITSMSAFNFGATLVLPSPTYNALENLRAIQDERCTIVHGTPTMYVDLINMQRQQKLDINIEMAVTGGAPCSPELFKQIQEILKVQRLTSVYGLTEATAVVFQSIPTSEDGYKSTATVGCVGEHLEVKVVDGDNSIVPIGNTGELCVRGYSTMLGYWDDEKKTKEMIGADGWLRTGDQFILQENGYGQIVGRLKDLIIRGGENIFPKEIEDLLNTHPDVLESHVVGLTHERLGEEICACVRLKQGAKLTQESLAEFCKGKIAHFKIPAQLRIVDTFPKTLSGKIQKYLLKEQFDGTNK